MHYLVLIGIAAFFMYFLIRKEWVSLSISSLLLALSILSSFITLWVEIALFAALLILFVDGLLSINIRSYPTIFAVAGLTIAHLISVPFVTSPWFFTALVPVAALSLSSVFEIFRYVSGRRMSDRAVMMNFIYTFIASLLVAFSGFIYVIT